MWVPAYSSAKATAWYQWMIRTLRTSASAQYWMACHIAIEPHLSPQEWRRKDLDQPHARDHRLQPAQGLRRLRGERRDGNLLRPALLELRDEIRRPLLDG